MKPGVFGSDGCVVETGRDGVRARDLTVIVLQEVAAGAVENAGGSAGESGGVLAEREAVASGSTSC